MEANFAIGRVYAFRKEYDNARRYLTLALEARPGHAEVLAALGMPTAFGPHADFTGMIESPGVFLSRVIHEAFVRVDERGAEAAAATAVIGKRGALPPPFRADHPFLFAIRDRATGSLLFLGRVVEP